MKNRQKEKLINNRKFKDRKEDEKQKKKMIE